MLVERRYELGQLQEAFGHTVAGKGHVVLISGGLASGKTALLHAASERLAERGAVVLAATGTSAGWALPMGVVRQLVRGLQADDAAPDLLARLARLVDDEPGVVDGEEVDQDAVRPADVRAAHGISELLLDLADDRPVVVAVDDVQFVDAASMEVLRHLRCRMRSSRVLVVVTERERPNGARPALCAELTRQPDRRITLGPLSRAGVAELVSLRLGAGAAMRFAPWCYALAGGNPFLTTTLVEDHHRRAGQQPGAVVGTAFREAVLDCLHRWDQQFHRTAAAMAVLGEHATTELIGELLAVQPRSVRQLVDALAVAGLVESGRLRHAELVHTVLGSLSPDDRSRLHAQAAALLYRKGADAVEVARHLAAVDSVPGRWAVGLLRHAADQVIADDAEQAVKYLELAIRACDDRQERVALRACLVRAAWRVNPSAAAWHLTPLHGALRAGEVTWRDAVPVLRHLLWQGDLDGAAGQLAAVHAAAGPPDGRTAAELRLAGEWIYGRLCDRVPQDAHAWLAATEPTDGAPAHPWRRAAALNGMWAGGAAGGAIGDPVGTAEHLLQACLGDMLPEVGATALLALDHNGRQQRVAFWADLLADEAERRQDVTSRAVYGCVRADLAWRRGDPATAVEQASRALGLLHAQSWGALISLPLSVLIMANTALGEYDAAAELLDRPVPQATFGTRFGLRYLHASGHYHLACGRPLTAIDDFERCGTAMREWGFDVPAVVPWRSDLAQAYLQLGLRRQAAALVTEQLARPRPAVGVRVRAISLRVLAACGRPAERGRLLGEAVRLLQRCGDRLELIRALTDLGRAYRELGDTTNAQLALNRADQVARGAVAVGTPAGPPPQPRRPTETPQLHRTAETPAPRRTVETPARKPAEQAAPGNGVDTLSGAEHKVAALAADGHSNREIGRQLSITVSTVEQHLTRVYRKLNVSRRAELRSELCRGDGVEDDTVERETADNGSKVLVRR